MNKRSKRLLWMIPALAFAALIAAKTATNVMHAREETRIRNLFMDGITKGDVNTVRAAVMSGYKVGDWNKRDGLETETPLSVSVEKGNADMVGFLVDNGLSPNLKTSEGVSPLQQAALQGQAEVAEVLTKKGADLNACNGGLAPLDVAVLNKKVQVVRVLLMGGANPKGCGTSGKLSPVETAASDGNGEIIAMLISAGSPAPLSYVVGDDKAKLRIVQTAICKSEADAAVRAMWNCPVKLPATVASAIAPLRGAEVEGLKTVPSKRKR